jgi:hypothetical protein
MPKYPYRTAALRTNHTKMFLQILPLILVVIASLVGISQLSVVREWLSRASGEPANIFVDTQAVIGNTPRPWRNLAQGGEDHAWRIGSLTGQVKALHPEYIRIDHIYDFYDIVKGTPGNLTFDFSKLDPLLDDIAATGAKPYISLSYMPPVISSGDILATPVRWEDWQLTVQKTIEHVSGTRKTADVYYEVWNEPDLFGSWKAGGGKSYLTLYNSAARGAANARGVTRFKFGGPGITALYKNWFNVLAKNAADNNVRFDFFSWHRYNLDIDQYRKDMFDARSWLADYPQLEPTVELHITEWGHDSNVHPGYDTMYGAAHTVAGAIEMVGVVDRAFAFEIQDGKDPKGQEKWGRWGLFTHNDFGGKPKPRYSALRFMDRIANQRLQLFGKGSFVKALAARTETGSTQILMANFDKNSRNIENVPITFQNIEPGIYTLTTEYLGGRRQVSEVATTAAELQVNVPMQVNTVGLVELAKK